jgi:hypothetical protein
MLSEVRSGVDYRDVAIADDIGSRSHELKRARISGNNLADHRSHRPELAIFEWEVAAERDFATALRPRCSQLAHFHRPRMTALSLL